MSSLHETARWSDRVLDGLRIAGLGLAATVALAATTGFATTARRAAPHRRRHALVRLRTTGAIRAHRPLPARERVGRGRPLTPPSRADVDAGGRGDDGRAEAAARLPAQPLDGPADADRRDQRAVAVGDRRADRRHAGLALLDALDPTGAVRRRRTAPGRPNRRASGSSAPSGTIQRSPCDDCSDTTQRRPSPSRTNSWTLSPVSSRSATQRRAGRARRAGTRRRRPGRGRPARGRGRSGRRRRAARGRAARGRRRADGPSPGAVRWPPAARPARPGRSRSRARSTATALSSTPTSIRCPRDKNTIPECETDDAMDSRRPCRRRCGSATSCTRRRRARPALHRPPPRPRGHQPAGLRRAAPDRARACAAPS